MSPRTPNEIADEIIALRALNPVGKFARKTAASIQIAINALSGHIDETADEFTVELSDEQQMTAMDAINWKKGDFKDRPSEEWGELVEFPVKAGKPFGFDVEVRCINEPRYRTFHWQGSEATMRRKARLQSTFIEIVSMKPLTRAQWERAYGLGRM